jgi:hypothetical protein
VLALRLRPDPTGWIAQATAPAVVQPVGSDRSRQAAVHQNQTFFDNTNTMTRKEARQLWKQLPRAVRKQLNKELGAFAFAFWSNMVRFGHLSYVSPFSLDFYCSFMYQVNRCRKVNNSSLFGYLWGRWALPALCLFGVLFGSTLLVHLPYCKYAVILLALTPLQGFPPTLPLK